MTNVRHPEVAVKLIGEPVDAFEILNIVALALYRSGVADEEINAYLTEATSGDFDDLLTTTVKWVEVV